MDRHRALHVVALGMVAAIAVACTGQPARQAASTTASAASVPAVGTANPASAGTAVPGSARAAAPSPSRIETVKLVYDLLLDRYVKPLKSNDLLGNAWKGATQAAGRAAAGIDAPKLSGDRAADWNAFQAQYLQLYAKAVGPVQATALAFGAADAMANGLHDDHTYFLNPEDNARRLASDSGGDRYVGIGVTLSQRQPWTVETVVPGAPADTGGVRSGDVIVTIDGSDAGTLRSQDLGQRLRGGQAGTPVSLTLKHPDGTTSSVSITRAEIIQPAIDTRMLPGGIGYIALHGFADAYARFAGGKNIAETLDAALASFEQAGAKGWVVDLRDNPGGSEQTLAEFAGRFLPDGLVLVSTDRQGQTTEAPVDGHLFPTQRPLAVLINGQSASASELFAATMKEYGRGHLVGQRTQGAVNGGLESELPDGAAIQYTVVDGRSGKDHKVLDGVGVSPDETVGGSGNSSDILAGGTDPQFERAKAWVLSQPSTLTALKPRPKADTLSTAQLLEKLQPYAAKLDDVPAGPARAQLGYLTLNQPNELAIGVAADVPNAAAFEQKVRERHWQGGYQQYFGLGDPPVYIVTLDLYQDVNGARGAVQTNDYPTGLKALSQPLRLGDETAAYAGYSEGAGSNELVWRRGRLVFTVDYTSDPGEPGLDKAVALAQVLDKRAATLPAP